MGCGHSARLGKTRGVVPVETIDLSSDTTAGTHTGGYTNQKHVWVPHTPVPMMDEKASLIRALPELPPLKGKGGSP